MTSNRKTIILEQQNSKKTTVTPNVLNEMHHDQMDMVYCSICVLERSMVSAWLWQDSCFQLR